MLKTKRLLFQAFKMRHYIKKYSQQFYQKGEKDKGCVSIWILREYTYM